MSDLSEFLLARIAEDEEVARATESPPWTAEGDRNTGWGVKSSRTYETWRVSPADTYTAPVFLFTSDSGYGYAETDEDTAHHIARWDPARVLAECDAKRRIVRLANSMSNYLETAAEARVILRSLALPYADHEDFRQEWRP